MRIDVEAGAEAWALLAVAIEPACPPPALRDRLTATLEGPARYLPFAKTLGTLFGLSDDALRAVLRRASEDDAWRRGIFPVERYCHFDLGGARKHLHAGLVEMAAGAVIPAHCHRDREVTLVLEGAVVDGTGASRRAGEWFDMPPGSIHSLRIEGDDRSVLAVLRGGIEFLGY